MASGAEILEALIQRWMEQYGLNREDAIAVIKGYLDWTIDNTPK